MSSAGAKVQELNRELARKINLETRSNPDSVFAGKFVGIANGQVVVVADNLEDLAQRLRQAEPDATSTMCVEASRNYDLVEEIWSLY